MKPILFIDFDGTICRDRFWRGLGPVGYERAQEFLTRDNSAMMEAWMRGRYTSEQMNEFLAEALNMPYDELWGVFVQDARTMHIPDAVLSKIDSFRDKYYTVLVTINTDSLDRFTVPALGLDTYFDRIVNSYNDGRFKFDNDGEVFIDIANELYAPIPQSYLFDDSEKNCDVFAKLGGNACRVDEHHPITVYFEQLGEI